MPHAGASRTPRRCTAHAYVTRAVPRPPPDPATVPTRTPSPCNPAFPLSPPACSARSSRCSRTSAEGGALAAPDPPAIVICNPRPLQLHPSCFCFTLTTPPFLLLLHVLRRAGPGAPEPQHVRVRAAGGGRQQRRRAQGARGLRAGAGGARPGAPHGDGQPCDRAAQVRGCGPPSGGAVHTIVSARGVCRLGGRLAPSGRAQCWAERMHWPAASPPAGACTCAHHTPLIALCVMCLPALS